MLSRKLTGQKTYLAQEAATAAASNFFSTDQANNPKTSNFRCHDSDDVHININFDLKTSFVNPQKKFSSSNKPDQVIESKKNHCIAIDDSKITKKMAVPLMVRNKKDMVKKISQISNTIDPKTTSKILFATSGEYISIKNCLADHHKNLTKNQRLISFKCKNSGKVIRIDSKLVASDSLATDMPNCDQLFNVDYSFGLGNLVWMPRIRNSLESDSSGIYNEIWNPVLKKRKLQKSKDDKVEDVSTQLCEVQTFIKAIGDTGEEPCEGHSSMKAVYRSTISDSLEIQVTGSSNCNKFHESISPRGKRKFLGRTLASSVAESSFRKYFQKLGNMSKVKMKNHNTRGSRRSVFKEKYHRDFHRLCPVKQEALFKDVSMLITEKLVSADCKHTVKKMQITKGTSFPTDLSTAETPAVPSLSYATYTGRDDDSCGNSNPWFVEAGKARLNESVYSRACKKNHVDLHDQTSQGNEKTRNIIVPLMTSQLVEALDCSTLGGNKGRVQQEEESEEIYSINFDDHPKKQHQMFEKVEQGMLRSYICHQYQRNNKGRVIQCAKCRLNRFCEPCTRRWYPKLPVDNSIEFLLSSATIMGTISPKERDSKSCEEGEFKGRLGFMKDENTTASSTFAQLGEGFGLPKYAGSMVLADDAGLSSEAIEISANLDGNGDGSKADSDYIDACEAVYIGTRMVEDVFKERKSSDPVVTIDTAASSYAQQVIEKKNVVTLEAHLKSIAAGTGFDDLDQEKNSTTILEKGIVEQEGIQQVLDLLKPTISTPMVERMRLHNIMMKRPAETSLFKKGNIKEDHRELGKKDSTSKHYNNTRNHGHRVFANFLELTPSLNGTKRKSTEETSFLGTTSFPFESSHQQDEPPAKRRKITNSSKIDVDNSNNNKESPFNRIIFTKESRHTSSFAEFSDTSGLPDKFSQHTLVNCFHEPLNPDPGINSLILYHSHEAFNLASSSANFFGQSIFNTTSERVSVVVPEQPQKSD